MQWLASICVRRPVFASVLILTLTVVGAFSFSRLGVDRFPKIDFPSIVITTRLPGATPEQVETEISDKIEEAVNTISGIDELRSTSAEGVSLVVVTFLLDKDVDVAAQEVRDRVNRALPLLPRNIDQPTIEKLDPDASPILTLAVSSKRPIRDVTEFADKVLRRQLESVNGVGQVLVIGGRGRQVNVWLDAARLRAYNVTVTDVSRALETQNAEIPGGRVEQGPETLSLRTLGRVGSIAEFNQVVVKQRDGHPVLLGDVARVEDGMADAQSLARIDGVGTVMLLVRRQSGTNTVEVVKNVKQRLDDVKPTLPSGYDVRIVRDQSEFIEASIKSVEEHLVVGAFLAALVVLLFLGNWRSTIIASIAIPASIIATFGLIWYMGLTLNSMTMLGLTLAVGIVIDDAIVVLENIWRFIEEKEFPPFQAAIEATREIGLAVLATTLSLVAVFIPVAFMGGIVGRFMKSFGFTMAFAVLVSLLVSFTLTPMMSARLLKRRPEAEGGHGTKDSPIFRPIERAYMRALGWALKHRGIVVAVAVAVLLASVPLFMFANKTFLPDDDQSEFEVNVRAPEGASLEKTDLILNRIASRIRQRYPEVDYTLVTVADDQARTPNLGTVYIRLKPLDARERDQFEVMASIRREILPQFEAERLRMAVRNVATIGGGGNQNATIQFMITGPDLARLEQAATDLAAYARTIPSLVDVDTSVNSGKPEMRVSLDRLKAADLGVQPSDAANALRLLVGGDEVTTYNEGGEQYDVALRAEVADRQTVGAIGQLTVPSSRLGTVPLQDLATVSDGTSPSEINRVNRQRQVSLFANVPYGESQTPGMTALQTKVDEMGLGSEYISRFSGRSRELGRAAQNFVLAFGLSLVFMYLILAAQFESWLHPITILTALPLTLPFALLSIIIFGQSLNIYSALGLLVLFGVVKKNSILQIDHAINLHEGGLDRDAAAMQASRDRLRPILMTTFSFVAGMIPLVWSSGVGSGTNRAIGFVIIGGQTLVLALSLIVTPVAYSLFDDASKLKIFQRVRDRVWPGRAAATTAGAILLMLCSASGVSAQGIQVALGQAAPPAATAGAKAGVPATAPPTLAAWSAQLPPTGGPTLPLSIDTAVRMALENNPEVVIARAEPEIGKARVAQAKGAFVPFASGTLAKSDAHQPPSNSLLGTGVQTQDFFGSAGVRQRLPVFGGTWSASWDAARTLSNSILNTYNPALNAGLTAAFSQPLLKDLVLDAARLQLTLAKRNREMTDIRFREVIAQTVSDVKRAYWDLVAGLANVRVNQRSLELAQELERINRARVDVGQAPPLDLVSAQAEVAQRREQLLAALQLARDLEDRLRVLIVKPGQADAWTTTIEPTDRPALGLPLPDVDAAVSTMLQERGDLLRARIELLNAATAVKYYRNQRLPDLRLESSYRAAGLGGDRLIKEGGFPGTVVGVVPGSFGETMDQVWGRDYPTWTLGVTLSYPIGTSYERASLARAKLEEEQSRARVESLELRAIREVRQAGRNVGSATERIEATRAARELAQERLTTEQKRFEVGMSTSFLVVQAQRDLAQAEITELRAQLDYQGALINFEILQQAPQAGANIVLSGSNIVSLPPTQPRGITRTGGASSSPF